MKSRALPLIPLGLLLVVASMAIGQGEDEFKPGPFFANKCSMCHVMTNPKLPTDRAWADQVLRTT